MLASRSVAPPRIMHLGVSYPPREEIRFTTSRRVAISSMRPRRHAPGPFARMRGRYYAESLEGSPAHTLCPGRVR